jgi:hypothetical protein
MSASKLQLFVCAQGVQDGRDSWDGRRLLHNRLRYEDSGFRSCAQKSCLSWVAESVLRIVTPGEGSQRWEHMEEQGRAAKRGGPG